MHRRSISRFTSTLPRVSASAAALVLSVALPRAARAEPPSPDLLARLGDYAAEFEAGRTKAAFSIQGRLEKLDGDGKVDSVQEAEVRIDGEAPHRRVTIVRASEDGRDTTKELQKKAREDEAAGDKSSEKKSAPSLRMPFHRAEQARYVFDRVETDPKIPSRVRIAFAPKDPAKDTIEGSAWVDTATARVLTAGFKLSKPGTFVDHVHVTAEFAEGVPPGQALARITFDGEGGVLFFRKHFRGSTRFFDYRTPPAR